MGVEIQTIAVRDIEAFARDSSRITDADQVAPISVHRARAWARNPHAKPDDPGILVAYSDSQCIGYLGLMPGLLQCDKTIEPVSWLSTFYVPPKARGTSVGALLVMRAMGLNLNLAASASSTDAQQLYSTLRFQAPQSLPYYECNLQDKNLPLRSVRALLHKLSPRLSRPLAEHGGAGLAPVRAMLFGSLLKQARLLHPACTSKVIARVGADQIRPSAHSVVKFLRDDATINWMLNEPWVTTDKATSTPNHYFSDYRDHASHLALELRNSSGASVGFVVLWLTRKCGRSDVHLLDYNLGDEDYRGALFSLAIEKSIEFGADRICLPEDCASSAIRGALGRRLFLRRTRPYYVRFVGVAAPNVSRLELDFCDGDVPFA